MILLPEDAKLFYKLWFPLLDYVNEKKKVNELKDIATAEELDPAKVKEVANVLWNEPGIIDEYLTEKASEEMAQDEREIISSWKRCVQGRFLMDRHLKKGTIFISMDTEEVYQVQGIISSWEEMFYGAPLPLMVGATFIPFRKGIISDGLVIPYNIIIGSGMKRIFKDVYMSAKKNRTIHQSL